MSNKSPRSAASFAALFSILFLSLCLLTPVKAQTPFTSTDFLIADFTGQRIAVYDQNFTFKGYLDNSFPSVAGLELLSNGNLVAVGYSPQLRTYNRSGSQLGSFTHPSLGAPRNVEATATGTFFIATQNEPLGISEFDASGNYMRSLGVGNDYGSLAIVPGGKMLVGGAGYFGNVDIFNTTTGNFDSTIALDSGQLSAYAIFYSASTNTVLMSCYNDYGVLTLGGGYPTVVERDLDGNFIRAFYGPIGIEPYGLTRGPDGDVFVTQVQTKKVHRWNAAGVYLGEIDTSAQVTLPLGIVWAGNVTAPTAGQVSISGTVTANRTAVAGAVVVLTDPQGLTRTTRADALGNYKFEGLTAGESYMLSAMARGYRFDSQLVTAIDDLPPVVLTSTSSAKSK